MVARSLMISLAALCAAPALAQEATPLVGAPATKPSVEGYLCTFAGKCDGSEPQAINRDAPETKGFRLARPVVDSGDKGSARRLETTPAASVVHSRTRSRESYSDAGRRSVSTSPSQSAAVANSSAVANSGLSRPRADLMIGFDLNSARLTAEGVAATQTFAKSLLMPELRSKRFLIEGHTDLRGSRALNLSLSRQRAQAVADYLIILGVKAERLQTRGFGPDAPLPGHRSTDPTNRRVEAELIS